MSIKSKVAIRVLACIYIIVYVIIYPYSKYYPIRSIFGLMMAILSTISIWIIQDKKNIDYENETQRKIIKATQIFDKILLVIIIVAASVYVIFKVVNP